MYSLYHQMDIKREGEYLEGKDCVVAAWSNLHPAECIHSSKFKMADFEGDEIVDYRDDEGNEDLQPSESYSGSSADVVEPEQFKQRVLEMEEELEKLTKMEQQVEKQITSATDKIDETSMYVYIFFNFHWQELTHSTRQLRRSG